MSQENVTRRHLDAYNRRDVDTLRALSDCDLELDWSASSGMEAGVYRGIDAVLRLYRRAFEVWGKSIIEQDRFLEAGDMVVVECRLRAGSRRC
jgi:ketosteroid isomerase-like protein